jgi:nitrogen regulatory protein PII-like uncharacterized protein
MDEEKRRKIQEKIEERLATKRHESSQNKIK